MTAYAGTIFHAAARARYFFRFRFIFATALSLFIILFQRHALSPLAVDYYFRHATPILLLITLSRLAD